MSGYKTIRISERLHKFLDDNCLKRGETYEETIWRLLALKHLSKEQANTIKAKYEEHLK